MYPGLVSVVVPVFNGEQYLDEALTSVMKQDYRPFEIIVVDDGSTDGSAGIARSFGAVRYLYQENLGPAAARNTGIAAARGEVVAFLDSDDVWLPQKLSIQMSQLLRQPQIGYISARMKWRLEEGIERPIWIHPRILLEVGADNEPYFPVPSSWAVRRSVFDHLGMFDPIYRQAEDVDWLFRAIDGGISTIALPDVVGYKRVHASNISRERKLNRRMVFRALHASIQRKQQLQIGAAHEMLVAKGSPS